MRKCIEIILETEPKYIGSIFNIAKLLGFCDVYSRENEESATISFYIRETDKEIILYNIIKKIVEFSNKYDREIPLRIRENTDLSNLFFIEIDDIQNWWVSFKDTSILYNMKDSSKQYFSSKYSSKVLNNKNIISIPIDNNEMIINMSSYMDTFKNNLLILYSLQKQYGNDLSVNLIGENIEIYEQILKSLNIQVSDKSDIHLINAESFKANVRLLMNDIIDKYKNIIISGIYDLYLDYYNSQLSDLQYEIIRTNRWNSIIIGEFDKSLYLENGNGY